MTSTRGALLHQSIPEHGPELVVLTDRVAPDPAVLHRLLVVRTPHLLIRLVDGDGQIGPFMVPGRTGCLWCEQHHAADADPLWSELLRRIGSMSGQADNGIIRSTLALATVEIGHITRFLRGTPPTPPPRCLGSSVEIGHDGTLSPPRRRPAHPRCAFQSTLPHHEPPTQAPLRHGPPPPALPSRNCMIQPR